jgi:hypothetical protein
LRKLAVRFEYLSFLFQHEIEQFYAEKEITVDGRDIPNPIFAFEEGCFPG